jgi:hypothetical protein
MLFLLATLLIAKAQVVPHYSEVYEERPGGKLLTKEWVSAEGNFRQEGTKDGDGTYIHIFRRDSMMMYVLDPAKKTVMTMAWSQISDPNKMFGMKMTESENTKAEFIKTENVEGYECDYWKYTTTTVTTTGHRETTYYHQWMYKPLNTWIRQSTDVYGRDPHIKRNIAQGAQAASLFTVPRDYKRMALPTSGLLEMITGKSKAENQKAADEVKQSADGLNDKLKEIDRNPDQGQQLQDALKLLNESQKKKK